MNKHFINCTNCGEPLLINEDSSSSIRNYTGSAECDKCGNVVYTADYKPFLSINVD